MSTSVVLMNKVNTPSYSLTSAALLRRLSHCVCVWMVCVLLRKFGGLTALVCVSTALVFRRCVCFLWKQRQLVCMSCHRHSVLSCCCVVLSWQFGKQRRVSAQVFPVGVGVACRLSDDEAVFDK